MYKSLFFKIKSTKELHSILISFSFQVRKSKDSLIQPLTSQTSLKVVEN
ncbi:MAG: hypothetical protein LBU14_04070 [Candidatus Peribacteria bacterium]|nr:hypothetical protein [Candidatus Peribacteria bacterium]